MPDLYLTELRALRATYELARAGDPPPGLVDLLHRLVGRQAFFVGSGGALAVAQFAAELHMRTSGQSALALPPMLFAQSPRVSEAAAVVFSSGARNPDAAVALAAARARQNSPVGLVTTRPQQDLPSRVARHKPIVATVSSPPNGFLATGSVLATIVALCLAAGMELPESDQLAWDFSIDVGDRPELLVLFGGGMGPVATDIQTRISELGLRSVQIVDYRSFAHGRHVGYSRRTRDTTVVALVDTTSQEVASRTLAALPPDSHIVQVVSDLAWPGSLVELLLWAMALPLQLADGGLDPAKPKVKPFGRTLYHLPIQRALAGSRLSPAERKSSASGLLRSPKALEPQLAEWVSAAANQQIGGLVLDYDGTVCATDRRFEPPDAAIQDAITTLAKRGLSIGFASGRGRSLWDGLRTWLPERFWGTTLLGLYNGSVLMSLADDMGDYSRVPVELRELAAALQEELGTSAKIVSRSTQISVSLSIPLSGDVLLGEVRSVLERLGGAWKAVASGHSVDIINRNVSKRDVLNRIWSDRDGLHVLAVGDQGQWGGNDFELLASTALSLSVDRVSSDPSRCWNLDARGEKGPRLLRRYLKAIKFDSTSRARFDWTEPL